MNDKKVLTVVGARPQFVKAAVVSRRLRGMASPAFEEVLVHTGQHYDPMLSDVFFEELDVGVPRYHLGVGSHASATQGGIILEKLDPIFDQEQPDALLVYGDTTSTLAAALCATYHNVPVVHMESGERIYRRNKVPEETNRVLTDHAATLCLTATARARTYLLREGMYPGRVRFVGDPMYDLFKWAIDTERVSKRADCTVLGLSKGGYHLSTIHRAENTADRSMTLPLLKTLDASSKPVILPIHPRLGKLLKRWNWVPRNNLRLVEPLGYFDFLSLLMDCEVCITDSGGVTRECFFARKPCIIPMANSWWSEVVESGWAVETGSDHRRLAEALETFHPPTHAPDDVFGNGDSALQIIDAVADVVERRPSEEIWHPQGAATASQNSPRGGGFSLADYAYMIRQFQEREYQFVSFPEAKTQLETGQPFILMRHDVDMSLEAALQMARLEADLGVQSTYFFLLRTDHYNVFSKDGSNAVSQILAWGHNLGLHFDCASYPADLLPRDLAQACAREVAMLEGWFSKPVSIVSYHRPDSRVLTGDPVLSAPLPHTYMELFRNRIRYISDSGGRWSNGPPTASLEFDRSLPLHVLVHPVWWTKRPTSPYETLLQLVDQKTDSLQRSIARNCKVFAVAPLNGETE